MEKRTFSRKSLFRTCHVVAVEALKNGESEWLTQTRIRVLLSKSQGIVDGCGLGGVCDYIKHYCYHIKITIHIEAMGGPVCWKGLGRTLRLHFRRVLFILLPSKELVLPQLSYTRQHCMYCEVPPWIFICPSLELDIFFLLTYQSWLSRLGT